jgi:hypothetical protein
MGFEHEGPDGANFGDSTSGRQGVRWEDREEARRWFRRLLEAAKDLRGAGRDRVRPKRRRVLSRHEAGRQLKSSWEMVEGLIEAGEVGFERFVSRGPSPEPEGPSEEGPPFSSSRPTHPSDEAS